MNDEMAEQMSQYSVCAEDLNDIQSSLDQNSDDDVCNTAPITQHTRSKGEVDLDPDLNERYDLSGDLGIPSTDQ